MADELLIPIAADTDVVTARQRGRDLAAEAGFSSGDQTVIAAAISEIARNILMYASTSGGLGLGLPGARRLMDDFDVSSSVGKGTTVTMKKWRRMNA